MEYKIIIFILINNLHHALSEEPTLINNECQSSACNLLAGPNDCTAHNSIHKSNEGIADIRDYHWMALMGEKNENGNFVPQCTGFLISHRYVITAGHCALHFNSKNKSAIIRLGEYDINKEIDCQDDICLDAAIDVDVEKMIIHENFSSRPRRNNIALLRLAKEIPYNANISPICLPSVVTLNPSAAGERLLIAGWGGPGFLSNDRNNMKVEATLPIFDQENCTGIYAKHKSEVTDLDICAGGEGVSPCQGDSGAPLMKQFENKWIAEGITSYGAGCHQQGIPTVFTRISKYDDWIKKNIEP